MFLARLDLNSGSMATDSSHSVIMGENLKKSSFLKP